MKLRAERLKGQPALKLLSGHTMGETWRGGGRVSSGGRRGELDRKGLGLVPYKVAQNSSRFSGTVAWQAMVLLHKVH